MLLLNPMITHQSIDLSSFNKLLSFSSFYLHHFELFAHQINKTSVLISLIRTQLFTLGLILSSQLCKKRTIMLFENQNKNKIETDCRIIQHQHSQQIQFLNKSVRHFTCPSQALWKIISRRKSALLIQQQPVLLKPIGSSLTTCNLFSTPASLLGFWQSIKVNFIDIYQKNFKGINQNNLMTQAQGISQLSLLKNLPQTPTCSVFCHHDSKLLKYELPLDDSLTVQGLILETIRLAKCAHQSLSFSLEKSFFQLYASRKNGKQINDLPSLQGQQRVINTGLKFFYLKDIDRQVKCSKQLSTVSTKSIQSQIKVAKIVAKEVNSSKDRGCFCF